MALMVFTASAAAKIPITMWLSSQPAGINAWAEEFEKQFNAANPDIELNVEIYPTVSAQRDKLIVAIAGGIGPDIVYDANNLMSQWYNTGIALPLDDYFYAWSGQRDVMPDMLESLRFGGKLYGMPFSVWSTGDLYNLDLFSAAGVSLPNNWDEMINTARRLRRVEADGRVSVKGYNVADAGAFNDVQLAMEQLGSTIIDIDGTVSNLNTAEAIRALTYVRDVTQTGNPGAKGTSDVKQLLGGQMAIFHSFNGYNLVNVTDAIKQGGINLEYRRMVGPNTGESNIVGNGGMLYITTSSKNPDAAWRVIEAYMDRNTLKSYVIAHGASLPTRMSLHSDNEVRNMPWAKEMMSVLLPPINATGSRHPYAIDFRGPAGDEFRKAITNQSSIEAVLAQANSIINAIVAEKMGIK
jgi:ABC-type glycerol-3-phosphate transport system substrate-binding protein